MQVHDASFPNETHSGHDNKPVKLVLSSHALTLHTNDKFCYTSSAHDGMILVDTGDYIAALVTSSKTANWEDCSGLTHSKY